MAYPDIGKTSSHRGPRLVSRGTPQARHFGIHSQSFTMNAANDNPAPWSYRGKRCAKWALPLAAGSVLLYAALS